jgi:cytochrome c oxidase assembly factor CtaG
MIAGTCRWEDDAVSSTLPAPGAAVLFSQWSWQPLMLAGAVVLACWYVPAARRAPTRWPLRRYAVFGLGLLLLVWTSCGFLSAYLDSMYWVWTTQVLALWLLIPGVLLAGQPVQLALATSGPRGPVGRFLDTGVARFLSNPLVGPALVPVLSFVLFFGPVPAWAVTHTWFGWLLQPALVLLGALMLLPLLGIGDESNALAVALTLALGSFELVLDAIPGIVLRLSRSPVSGYFDHRVLHPWSRPHLADQQTAGAVLWVVAELIDLPFLLLVFRRWLRADARDAAEVDAVLDAEYLARTALQDPDTTQGPADVPWWVSDPAMLRRLRGQG